MKGAMNNYSSLIKAYELMGRVARQLPRRVNASTNITIARMLYDLPLTSPQTEDFGIGTMTQYMVLKEAMYAALEEMTLAEFARKLDKVRGNGKKITALVKRYAPGYGLEYQPI